VRQLKFLVVMALAVAASACAARAGSGQEVTMTIHHSRFLPGELTFDRGDTVTFILINDDPIDHEFILGDQDVQDRHEFGTEAHHDAVPTEVSVPAGETVRTTVTFDEPGELIIGCHLPTHYAYGMKAKVTVAA
jgi:uncharacterized cupredoxin-like copper-binding protein